jgi:hypothetical protein
MFFSFKFKVENTMLKATSFVNDYTKYIFFTGTGFELRLPDTNKIQPPKDDKPK